MHNKIDAAIITIGDELLIGQTIDTNSAFIAQELNKIGIWIKKKITVGDTWDEIWHAIDETITSTQIIIITGGLGPTADDITKPLLCKYFEATLILNEEVLEHIGHLFRDVYLRKGSLPGSSRSQALVPDNCKVIHNDTGSAPGMWFTKNNCNIISLPGVPSEMTQMIQDEIIPQLKKQMPLPSVLHKNILTMGYGEAMIEAKISTITNTFPSQIKLAFLPGYGHVKLRLTGLGNDEKSLQALLNNFTEQIVKKLGDWVASTRFETIEETIGEIFLSKKITLCTAESCTGGLIASMIASVAGSSVYFKGSVVSYANDIKQNVLHVPKTVLQNYGAVSEQTVIEMARYVKSMMQTDVAIATSGIMGPSGGTPQKPVGTVWIACAFDDKIITNQLNLRFDRKRNTIQTAIATLNFLRLCIANEFDKKAN